MRPLIANKFSFNLNIDNQIFSVSSLLIENAFKGIIYPEYVSIGIPLTKKNKTSEKPAKKSTKNKLNPPKKPKHKRTFNKIKK